MSRIVNAKIVYQSSRTSRGSKAFENVHASLETLCSLPMGEKKKEIEDEADAETSFDNRASRARGRACRLERACHSLYSALYARRSDNMPLRELVRVNVRSL